MGGDFGSRQDGDFDQFGDALHARGLVHHRAHDVVAEDLFASQRAGHHVAGVDADAAAPVRGLFGQARHHFERGLAGVVFGQGVGVGKVPAGQDPVAHELDHHPVFAEDLLGHGGHHLAQAAHAVQGLAAVLLGQAGKAPDVEKHQRGAAELGLELNGVVRAEDL